VCEARKFLQPEKWKLGAENHQFKALCDFSLLSASSLTPSQKSWALKRSNLRCTPPAISTSAGKRHFDGVVSQ
jgi:hypothetical protein